MNLAIDTSVILAVLTSEPEKRLIVELTKDADLVGPSSVHWEIGNALSAMIKRGRMTLSQAQTVLAGYEKIPIRFIDVELNETVQLAKQLNLYAYDAYLILCAREQKCALISLDRGLLSAAQKAGVEVLEVQGT